MLDLLPLLMWCVWLSLHMTWSYVRIAMIVYMSRDCSFDSHITSLSRKCNNLAGWILRTFVSRDKLTMLTLFKSLVISRLDYASQLWSPHKISQITQIEKVQRSFTKHIAGLRDLSSYHERTPNSKTILSPETKGEILYYSTLENN